MFKGVLSIADGTDFYCARGDFSHINALSDVIVVSLFLGVAEVVFGSGCFRIVNFDGNRLLKWVISIEDGTTEHCASGDFPYPSALRKFSITLSHVQAFPGHFTDLGMPNRVHSRCTIFLDVDVFLALLSSIFLHSWCTIFRDVDVFLALLSSTYLHPSLPSQCLRWQRLIFSVRFAHSAL